MRSTWPGRAREVKGGAACSTRTCCQAHTKSRSRLRSSAPGSRPASHSTWKPLQVPSTGPPASAKRRTAAITGEKRAIAPQRR